MEQLIFQDLDRLKLIFYFLIHICLKLTIQRIFKRYYFSSVLNIENIYIMFLHWTWIKHLNAYQNQDLLQLMKNYYRNYIVLVPSHFSRTSAEFFIFCDNKQNYFTENFVNVSSLIRCAIKKCIRVLI